MAIRVLTASVLWLLLVATACGDSARPEASTPGSSTPSVAPGEGFETTSNGVVQSPLEAAVGFSSDPGRRRQQIVSLQRQANEQIVECMRRAGFMYFVPPLDDRLLLGRRAGDGSRAWVESNGLGVTVALIEATSPNPETTRLDAGTANEQFATSLSAEEAAAYDVALIGDLGVPAATNPGLASSPGGCWGQSFGRVLPTVALAEQLASELERMNRRLDADPRMRALMTIWSTCMTDRGHRWNDRTALLDSLWSRLLEIEIQQSADGPRLADPSAAQQLLKEEIEIGLADHECRGSIAAELDELRAIYESEFVTDNRRTIDASVDG